MYKAFIAFLCQEDKNEDIIKSKSSIYTLVLPIYF